VSPSLPEPGPSYDAPALFLRYLDYYRETVADKVSGLTESELRSTRLPSGWTPIELVKHLVYMERRWLVWGFLAERVPDPWGDDQEDRWHVGADESLDGLLAALRQGGERTRAIVEAADPSSLAAIGGRFTTAAARPSLTAILFHVLQEYARHAGHLDIVRELIDERTGG
jgi:uncharacterized damage-inducible protein DinB